jgi:16S rRNA (cytidine1402-2'-O)-methyltransferase
MNGKLYLLPTYLDIEHLEVIPPKTAEIAIQLEFIIAENLRTTRRYLKKLDPTVNIDAITFFEWNNKSDNKSLDLLLQPALKGNDIGIFSEAGCPGIADPGQVIIRRAHELGIQVVPLSGPSAIFLALMAAGMNGQQFRFHGYLPIDESQKRKYITYLEKEAQQRKETQIFMETPFRNNRIIESLLKVLDDKTNLCLAANITADNEFIQTKKVSEWKKQVPDLHKQPCIFLIL